MEDHLYRSKVQAEWTGGCTYALERNVDMDNELRKDILADNSFSNRFFAVTQSMAENQQNFVTSPASVLLLLSVFLGSTGPRGKTANQICNTIVASTDPCTASVETSIRKNARRTTQLLEAALDKNGTRIVRVENAAFVQASFRIKPTFRLLFSDGNHNKFELVDFVKPTAYKIINSWVRNSTDNTIEKIYASPAELPPGTVMVLLNVIYFKAQWKNTFVPKLTTLDKFRLLPNGKKAKIVQMMKIVEKLKYYKNVKSGYHMVYKPFENERFAFIVMLPMRDMDITAVNAAIKHGIEWRKLENNAKDTLIELHLPKFKLSTNLDLKPALRILGIRDLFDQSEANLTGISKDGRLFVDSTRQNSVLIVNEFGVRAAAVSSMQVHTTSSLEPKIKFRANQPFFCLIYDRMMHLPLFIARLVHPDSI